MKRFISRLTQFFAIFVLFLTISSMFLYLYLNANLSYQLPANKKILILGDSHTECAINDKILNRSFNFSQSGTAHFYSLLKLKKMLANNSQIETVVLSYSYDDVRLAKDMWFTNHEYILKKVPRYFSLMEFGDIKKLLKVNPLSVIGSIPTFLVDSIYQLLRGGDVLESRSFLGGFYPLKKLGFEKTLDKISSRKIKNEKKKNSKFQLSHLKEIYDYCAIKGIKLVLINTPVFISNFDKSYISFYFDYAKQNLPEAKLIDHSNFNLEPEYFADETHLNYKGAEKYSIFLKEKGYLNGNF
jgi:hypothetical protein